MHRQCEKRLSPREELELDIATDVTETTRTMDEIRQTLLGKCFNGCQYMNGRCCTRWGKRCEHYQAWIEHLLENDCTPE